MQRFNLRFRHKKLFVAAGMLLALVLTPLMQSASAANVRLDMNYFSRVIEGPNATANATSPTPVANGSVVQFGVTIHNVEDANSGPTAKNVKVRVTIPKATATSVTSTASISADNGSSPAPYRGSDQVTLNSSNGAPFNMSNLRNVQVQHNNVPKTNTPTYNWGGLEDVPQSRITTAHTADNFVFVIQPTPDGDLGPCYQNAMRIFFLANVQQAPAMSLKKEVRGHGVTTFTKENSAKPGEQLEYAIDVRSNGASPAHNVVVRDVLPPTNSVAYVAGSCTLRSSDNPAMRPCGDAFKDGGLQFTSMSPGTWVQVFILVKVNQNICDNRPHPFFTNGAELQSNETPLVNSTAKTTVVCKEITPTPTPTPTPTTTPTVSPTPTPTPTSTPTVSPTPTSPPGPPTSGSLPKTGAASAALLSAIALAISVYLYVRERRTLSKVLSKSKLEK